MHLIVTDIAKIVFQDHTLLGKPIW